MEESKFSEHPVEGVDLSKESLGKNAQAKVKRAEGLTLTKKQSEYLLPQFFLLVVGKPGSGKTSLVERLLRDDNFYYEKFDTILVMSPSIGKLNIQVPKENTSAIFDLGWFDQWLAKLNKKQLLLMQKKLMPPDTSQGDKNRRIAQAYVQEVGLTNDVKHRDKTPVRVLNTEVLQHDMNAKFFTSQVIATAMGNGRLIFKSPHDVGGGAPTSRSQKKGKNKTQLAQQIERATRVEPILTSNLENSSVEWIERHIVKKLVPEDQRATHKNYLLILDDMSADIKANEYNPAVLRLFFNRRHLVANATFSIIVIAQKYTKIPAAIRATADWLILFRLNKIEFFNVFKDVSLLDQKQWESLLDFVFEGNTIAEDIREKRYDHLDVWVQYDKYFKNFNKILLNSDQENHDHHQQQPQQRKSTKDFHQQQPQQRIEMDKGGTVEGTLSSQQRGGLPSGK